MGKRVRHTEAESERTFRKATELLAGGATIAQACRKLQVSEATFHRWRKKFAPIQPPKLSVTETKQPRLKQLEMENRRLKLLVAELTLENAFLKDRLEGIEG